MFISSYILFTYTLCIPNVSISLFQGVHGRSVQEATNVMINDLQLEDKTNTPSRNLSGGMKRKLRYNIMYLRTYINVFIFLPTVHTIA